jgi:hypothetical protein
LLQLVTYGNYNATEFRICYQVWVDKVTRPNEEGANLPPTRHTPPSHREM